MKNPGPVRSKGGKLITFCVEQADTGLCLEPVKDVLPVPPELQAGKDSTGDQGNFMGREPEYLSCSITDL